MHVLLIVLFMLHDLAILFINSNTFIYKHFCLIYVCVLLANCSRKSHLILGLSRSRVSGEISMCLPLVSISIPFPVWVFRDLRVQQLVAERGCPQALPKIFSHQSIEGLNLGQRLLWRCDSIAWPCLLLTYTDLRLNN